MSETPTLHDYQLLARDFLRGRDRGAIWLDMGLGKTAVVLSALEPRHLPALVIAPKKVAETVWDAEREIWRPDLTLAGAVGDPRQRAAALKAGEDITVMGIENIGDLRGKLPYKTIIFDEMSKFKGRGVRWKMARKLVERVSTKYVWGLTGTPAPNGLLDIWAQIFLLDGGERLGVNYGGYRGRYFAPGRQVANGKVVEWIIYPESEERIHNLIDDICLAMETDGRIELPPVTHNPVRFDLPKKIEPVYQEMAAHLVADLKDLFDGKIHTASQAAVLSNKLTQISAGFLYEDEEYVQDPNDPDAYIHVNEGAYQILHWEKINAVADIIDAVDSPILVFYQYKAELEMLQTKLGALAHTIKEKDIIHKWNAGNVPALLLHPQSAGHGLNLQYGGHHAIWTTLPWPLDDWEQGNKRLIRQGQKHPVVIHSILGNHLVDHVRRARLVDKAIVQDSLLSHLESPV